MNSPDIGDIKVKWMAKHSYNLYIPVVEGEGESTQEPEIVKAVGEGPIDFEEVRSAERNMKIEKR